MDRSDAATPTLVIGAGSNHTRVREQNERLVLSLIQQQGALSRAEIARAVGLSAQAATILVRALEAEGLLRPGKRQRGKVGQPSIPMGLNPEGAFGLGLKIGRRSAEIVRTDLTGQIRGGRQRIYRWPEPDEILAFAKEGVAALGCARTAGLGVAMPFELWRWTEEVGAPQGAMAAWEGFDPAQALAEATGLSVTVANDATAACGAEHLWGAGPRRGSFAYLFIGFFAGGGIVLENALYPGPSGNAAAFGALPLGDGTLIDHASLFVLERRLAARGIDVARVWSGAEDWAFAEPELSDWIEEVAVHLATAARTIRAVVDVEAVLLDGAFPVSVRARLAARAAERLAEQPARGLTPAPLLAGTVGPMARSLGAATLPLAARYFLGLAGGAAFAKPAVVD